MYFEYIYIYIYIYIRNILKTENNMAVIISYVYIEYNVNQKFIN